MLNAAKAAIDKRRSVRGWLAKANSAVGVSLTPYQQTVDEALLTSMRRIAVARMTLIGSC